MNLPRLHNATYIADRLNELAAVVKTRSRANLTDTNHILETIFKQFFNALFVWDLVNLNIGQANYPAADLGDRQQRIAIQVTNKDGSDKIVHTTDKAIEHHLGQDFDRLIIFFLLPKKPRLPRNFVQPPDGPKIETWDIPDILKKMQDLPDLGTLDKAAKVLDEEMGKISAPGAVPDLPAQPPQSESSPQSVTVTQSYVSFMIHHPNNRTCKGRFLVSNKGSSICNIEDIVLFTEGIALPEYNLVAREKQPSCGVDGMGTQKLPLTVFVNQPVWVYFRTEEIAEVYRGKLPETVILKVFFDCLKEPACRTLKRVAGGHQYREE